MERSASRILFLSLFVTVAAALLAVQAWSGGASASVQQRWAPPPNVDEAMPPVTESSACDLPHVQELAARSVQNLTEDLSRYAARERVSAAHANKQGFLRAPERFTFDYAAVIYEIRKGALKIDEYRNGSLSPPEFPAQIVDRGLPAFALIFHPLYVGDYDMRCEGISTRDGQRTWQVYFRQRRDRPARMQEYRVGENVYAVKLKGRAWLAADTGDVLHLETDLVEPVPAIGLQSEHIVVDYAGVHFKNRQVRLWLPQSAQFFVEFHGRRYLIDHEFKDFQLFEVSVHQDIAQPKQPKDEPQQ